MDVSLVVCTRNRARQLARTLEAIERIETEVPWELIVVDNASDDPTQEVLRTFVRDTHLAVRCEHEPEPGLCRARNRGCRAAGGEVVCLIDDDCYPGTGFVEAVREVFSGGDVGWAGGRMILHDPSDAPVSVVDRDEAELLPAHRFPPPGFVGGGNLSFTRELFDAVGGFDEKLGVGTSLPCGDIEFCARASDRGWPGGYFPGPVVRHHHRRSPGREAEAIRRSYARARGAYYLKVLLDMRTLRTGCLKHLYWRVLDRGLAGIGREVEGAARYLARRGRPAGGPGREA